MALIGYAKNKLMVVFIVLILLLIAANVLIISGVYPVREDVTSSSDMPEPPYSEIIEENCGEIYLLTGNCMTLDDDCFVENESVAEIADGVITAIAPGQTRISLSDGTVCKYWTLTVSDYQEIVAPMGRKLQLETIEPCSQWSCSDTEYAEVDDTGSLTPKSVGECTVVAVDQAGRQYGWNVAVKRAAYLTIDDWPNEHTLVMLDIMKKYDVKATFFLASQKNHMDVYQRIIDEGHAIGNHTKTHNLELLYKSSTNLCRNVESMDKFLNEKFGVSTKLFRFPGGYYAKNAAQKEGYRLLKEKGYRIFDWTCVVEDIRCTDAEGLLREFRKTLDEDVEIILMHNKKSTAGVFEEVILYLMENDYVCLPLDEQCATFDFVHGWQE